MVPIRFSFVLFFFSNFVSPTPFSLMYWGLRNLGSHLGSTSGAHVTVHIQSVTPVPGIPPSGFQGHSLRA